MIFRAPELDVVIPDVALTPFLLERAAAFGDKPAFIDGPTGRTLTYSGWAGAVRKAAAGLSSRGFRKGDVFAIYSPNLPEYAVAFHAVSLLGGINTTINPAYTASELSRQLEDAGARALVTVPPCLDKAVHAAREAGVREVFVFGEGNGATPFASLLAGDGDPPAVAIDPRSQVVVLPYSSGTTGLPKGVMLTHRNLVANMLQTAARHEHRRPRRHARRASLLSHLRHGRHHEPWHLPRRHDRDDAAIRPGTVPADDAAVWRDVRQYRPSHRAGLRQEPAGRQSTTSSRVHTLFSGAAPLSERVAAAASARLGCRVVQGYGLTETSPVTHTTRTRGGPIKIGGIGPPVPNTEARVVDVTTGAELGPEEEGEICVRGPQVMKGYLNRPEATAAMVDADGWLHTGDVGFADEDGCFFIVDRLKELIKYKGMQIAPAELEAVLLSHPPVADAAVIPIADDECGEVPKAFVVLRGDVTPEEIMGYVAERVAPYKKLRAVEVIEQIPKSPSGKILRRVLIEQEKARTNPG